jgi:hypothetical protein
LICNTWIRFSQSLKSWDYLSYNCEKLLILKLIKRLIVFFLILLKFVSYFLSINVFDICLSINIGYFIYSIMWSLLVGYWGNEGTTAIIEKKHFTGLVA